MVKSNRKTIYFFIFIKTWEFKNKIDKLILQISMWASWRRNAIKPRKKKVRSFLSSKNKTSRSIYIYWWQWRTDGYRKSDLSFFASQERFNALIPPLSSKKKRKKEKEKVDANMWSSMFWLLLVDGCLAVCHTPSKETLSQSCSQNKASMSISVLNLRGHNYVVFPFSLKWLHFLNTSDERWSRECAGYSVIGSSSHL